MPTTRSGTPLVESLDLRVVANQRTSLSYTAGSTPEDVYLVIVARDMNNVRAKGCIVRRDGSTSSTTATASTRSIPIRVEDFVTTKAF